MSVNRPPTGITPSSKRISLPSRRHDDRGEDVRQAGVRVAIHVTPDGVDRPADDAAGVLGVGGRADQPQRQASDAVLRVVPDVKHVEERIARVAGGVADDLARLVGVEVRHAVDEEGRVVDGKVVVPLPAAVDMVEHGLDNQCGEHSPPAEKAAGHGRGPRNTEKSRAHHGIFPFFVCVTMKTVIPQRAD